MYVCMYVCSTVVHVCHVCTMYAYVPHVVCEEDVMLLIVFNHQATFYNK